MANTYRITLEYTTIEDKDPEALLHSIDEWNWDELLDIDTSVETVGMWAEKVETNEDHVQYIIATNEDN
jgi:hypothetical protein